MSNFFVVNNTLLIFAADPGEAIDFYTKHIYYDKRSMLEFRQLSEHVLQNVNPSLFVEDIPENRTLLELLNKNGYSTKEYITKDIEDMDTYGRIYHGVSILAVKFKQLVKAPLYVRLTCSIPLTFLADIDHWETYIEPAIKGGFEIRDE